MLLRQHALTGTGNSHLPNARNAPVASGSSLPPQETMLRAPRPQAGFREPCHQMASFQRPAVDNFPLQD